jgi:hypothetical protein
VALQKTIDAIEENPRIIDWYVENNNPKTEKFLHVLSFFYFLNVVWLE